MNPEDWGGDTPTSSKEETQKNETHEDIQVIPGYSSFQHYVQEAIGTIRAGIIAANNLPSSSDYTYYTCYPSFVKAKDENVKLLSGIMQHAIGVVGLKANVSTRSVKEKFDLLLEANDILVDRANILMDEESGIGKSSKVEMVLTQAKKQTINGSWNDQIHETPQPSKNIQVVRLLAGKNIQRPQLMFKDKIDNSSKPWCPRIKDKPNSLKPLAIFLEEHEDEEVFSHPYQFELDKFAPPEDQLKKSEPTKYKSLEETPLIMIEEPSGIQPLIDDLKRYKEIAVDLEHHSYRSYQGITCLMQISTGDKDYLIDTLSLRSELHELNEIFTKPTILKVFHGADLDIQWLQRDLSLYVVNMFDTHQAAKQLNLPYLSLAFLLKRYCNIDPNKHFQLADWRIRPLPDELHKYAREDTHYLLYIKDVLKNTLIDAANGQTNILKAVYDRSTEICKKVYVKSSLTEERYLNMYRKSRKRFNNKQMYALKELHNWRDQVARQEDDSPGYVLPNHMLLNIAETLPREMQGILACCNPIPPLVRQYLLNLHKIILKARDQPFIKPAVEDFPQRLSQGNQISNSEAWMHAPHDIPNDMEARADLPCLLDNDNALEISILNTTVKHTVTVFDSPAASEDEERSKDEEKISRKKKFVFASPYERYRRVMRMIEAHEGRRREKQKQEDEEEEASLNKSIDEKKEVAENVDRLNEQRKKVSETIAETVATPPKKLSQVSLSQMQGRKRKRDSNINRKSETYGKASDNFTSPVPSLDTRIPHGVKRERVDEEEEEECRKMKQKVEGDTGKVKQPADGVQSLRTRKKGEKKSYINDLEKKGMMPAKKFDYKLVDFSSFQGGSAQAPSQVNFAETMKKKKKGRGRIKKKTKINI